MKNFNKILNFLVNLPKTGALLFINLYQLTLSPDHGWFKAIYPHGFCRFYPTCSEYSKQSIQKYGLLKGAILTINRLVKCHPWAESKLDLVP